MQREFVQQSEMQLVGLSVRTNNKNEINPDTAKIGELFGRYIIQNLAEKIVNRKNPGTTFAVYTNYESNEHGDYTYFIGERVTSFENISEDFETLTIPESAYQKFTTEVAKMPDVVIRAWQEIWQMSDLPSMRTYRADFEMYDHRASDFGAASLDIFIGIK